jgi:hypothetical protein
LFMIIDVVIVLILLWCPCPPFISKGVGVIRKVSWPATIVILIVLYF